MQTNQIYQGDCFDIMNLIPSGSIDLIVTDPPYGNMFGAQLDGWECGVTDWDVALDPHRIFKESNRILRKCGTLVLFSQEPYTSRLITQAEVNIPFCYRMIWQKDHFANALLSKKAPVSYYEDIVVFRKNYDTDLLHPLRDYAALIWKYIGRLKKDIFMDMGNQGACHFMRYKTAQFAICTYKTYSELDKLYNIKSMDGFMEYDELERIDSAFKNTFKSVFNLRDGQKYKSNILSYKKPREGLHPTQKPVSLIEDLINTYSNEGNVVLDFTMGSGTTPIACINTNRQFIGIEKDEKYFAVAYKRIADHYKALGLV